MSITGDGIVTIGIDGRKQPAQLCWMGSVPFNYEDYNEAMAFIRQLNWSEKMTTAPVTLNDVLLENKIVERNSNVMNIAARLKEIDKTINQIEERRKKLAEQRETLIRLADNEDALGDTEGVNNVLRDNTISGGLVFDGTLESDIRKYLTRK